MLLRKGGGGDERRGKEWKREGEGKGREGWGERPYTPPVANSWLRHCFTLKFPCASINI